jgi:hypothetical protein
MASISLSIVIPTNDIFIQKDYNQVYRHKSPLEQDTSLWMSTAYEIWGILDVVDDIRKRISEDSNSLNHMDNIKEGIRIIKERVGYDNQFIISSLELIVEMKLQMIGNMKTFLIFRLDYLLSLLFKGDIDIPTIDIQKKEINKLTLEIKKAGANRDDLRQIGKKMQQVYKEISKYISNISNIYTFGDLKRRFLI